MQDVNQRSDAGESASAAKRLIVPTLALFSVFAGPICDSLIAKDGSKAKPEAKIARKIDETRSGSGKAGDKNAMTQVLETARSSREATAKLKDYSASFIKRERIGNQLTQHVLDLKFRQQPFSVYLRYSEPHAGREVIYVDGQNKGKLLVHEDGLKAIAGTLAFSTTSEEALKENRYPLTKLGMLNMIDITIDQWEQDAKQGDTEVKFYNSAKIGDVECKMIETSHAKANPHFKFQRTCLYIDKKTNLPVRIEQYGFPTKAGEESLLQEEYTYSGIKTNTGLGDKDFDTKNKDYNF